MRLGLATDAISQPLEVPATRAELRAQLLDDQGEPQLLRRLGWAPVSASPVPATGRRPVDGTIDPFQHPGPDGNRSDAPIGIPRLRRARDHYG